MYLTKFCDFTLETSMSSYIVYSVLQFRMNKIRWDKTSLGYWSSFSFWVIFSTLSCRVRIPRAQCWASSGLWQSRSRLLRGPLKTKVKQRPSGTEPAISRKVSDWQPSRTHSTSMTETECARTTRGERWRKRRKEWVCLAFLVAQTVQLAWNRKGLSTGMSGRQCHCGFYNC